VWVFFPFLVNAINKLGMRVTTNKEKKLLLEQANKLRLDNVSCDTEMPIDNGRNMRTSVLCYKTLQTPMDIKHTQKQQNGEIKSLAVENFIAIYESIV
jgi:hypothetical protein